MTKTRRNILFRFKSIKGAMIFFFSSIIILALLTFMIISLNYTEEAILANSKDYTMQLIEQVNSDIDSYINYMENISKMVSNNNDVVDYLFDQNCTVEEKEGLKNKVLAQFKTISDARNDIYNLAVMADNGNYVINDGDDTLNPYADIKNTDWYVNARESNGISVLSSSHVQNAIEDDYKWVVTLSCGLQSPYTGDIEGVLFVDLDYSAINDMCAGISLGSKGYVFIIDEEGGIVYHPRQTLLYSGLKSEKVDEIQNGSESSFTALDGEESKLYTICKSDKTGWTVVGVAYLNDLLKGRGETQLAYLLTAILLIIAATLISIVLSGEITKPLKELTVSMKAVQEGKFENAEIGFVEDNEIGMIGKSFNIMTKKIKELMDANVLEQKQKRKSELKALQSQINPHFLYNTLDSIIWTAEIGKNKEVVVMTSALSKLLRQSISNENEIVTIEKEIEYTKSYLIIQKMRYKDKLEFDINIDREISRKNIVKLVLQPLVENAIYHGIKYKEGLGLIKIYAESRDNNIYIYIEDNGIGMDTETLSHIFDERKSDKKSNGVGVNNVNGRLKLYYGNDYGLRFESEPLKGTLAEVKIPADCEVGNYEEI